MTARVKVTTITAPPGGGSRQLLEVTGSNFTRGVAVTLSFTDYPASDSSQRSFQRSTSSDAAGHFDWSEDLGTLPARNFQPEPGAEVTIAARDGVGCFSTAAIKADAILHPPIA